MLTRRSKHYKYHLLAIVILPYTYMVLLGMTRTLNPLKFQVFQGAGPCQLALIQLK